MSIAEFCEHLDINRETFFKRIDTKGGDGPHCLDSLSVELSSEFSKEVVLVLSSIQYPVSAC